MNIPPSVMEMLLQSAASAAAIAKLADCVGRSACCMNPVGGSVYCPPSLLRSLLNEQLLYAEAQNSKPLPNLHSIVLNRII